MTSSADIRAGFLSYFQERGHTVVKSASLLPGNDPTLLFANAGMVPFKDIFIGQEVRPYSRATSSQKCMRVSGKHNDLEEVGPSPRHHTFFEMLGNFSFGDYFKAEAIEFAWLFLTRELGLDRDRLYPTVYYEDDEALSLWTEIAELPASRITKLGYKDNYWSMGDTGPNGPCSEILYDRGPEACTCRSADCGPESDCDRWLELWNLVFMQYETRADGTTVRLPRPSIDTGMGLERITSVLQGVGNNYDTDLFLPIMDRTQALLGQTDAQRAKDYVAYRVIADHSRALSFLIADGVLPGNEGRNYVLRMILRRAARFGRMLGFTEPFLAETAQAVIDTMGHHYSELVERRDFIRQVVQHEEERFLTTLSVGLSRLDQLATQLETAGSKIIPGDEAFRLYDTYGFPIELTRDVAQDFCLSVDEEGFGQAMAEQRERARSAQRFASEAGGQLYREMGLPATEFVGYETTRAETRVVALVVDGQVCDRADTGDEVDVVLATTPFYGESGGQVGDTGEIMTSSARLEVTDTIRPIPDLVVHRGRVVEGALLPGEDVEAVVDRERRLDIARNHTATHLLHRALRVVLGEHAAQSGSLVTPERLRFDFAHLTATTSEEIAQVEAMVNDRIRANLPVRTRVSSLDEAMEQGAVALFGEKYGDEVRVVDVEGYSTELCGGTHLSTTGQIGLFHIVSESSVGSGLRRIEAVTGRGAETYVNGRLNLLDALVHELAARPGQELERAQTLTAQVREQRRTIQDLEKRLAQSGAGNVLDHAIDVDGIKVLSVAVQATDVETLREMCDSFRAKLGTSVVALGADLDGRPILVVAVTKDLLARGLHAGKLAGTAARLMGGGGGGRPDIAQAGGKDMEKLPQTLAAVPSLVKDALS